MKKYLFPLLCLTVLFLACKEKTAQVVNSESTAQTNQTFTLPKPQQKADIPGVMIAGWFYTLGTDKNGSETMNYSFQCIVGSKVMIYSLPVTEENPDGVEKKTGISTASDGTKKDFIHVKYDEEDYWVRDYSVAVNAEPGLVKEDGLYLYTKASLSSMGSKGIAQGTIVAVFNEALEGNDADRFYKIRYYVNDGKTYTVNGYLMQDTVDLNYDLVQMQQCMDKGTELAAEGKTDEAVLSELRENAEAIFSASSR